MAKKQSPKQREIVGRVMHEFKHGELKIRGGRKVKNPKQAIAIALHEAGASNQESPETNRKNLRKTKSRERSATAGDRGSAKAKTGQGGTTRAELYEQARRRGIEGRSRMSKAELERALKR